MKKRLPQDDLKYTVRLPRATGEEFAAAAADENRSVNGQITELIQVWLRERRARPALEGEHEPAGD